MKKIQFLASAIAVIAVFFSLIVPVRADVGAPNVFTQGGIIMTDISQTNVSMDYEKVILTYQPAVKTYYKSGEVNSAYMNCHVSAVFKMRNSGNLEEKMTVYFPAQDAAFVGGDFYNSSQENLTNFKANGWLLSDLGSDITVMIEGQPVKISTYQWEEVFPAQATKEITVEYDTKSAKNYEVFYLTYVLSTGFSWKGAIGGGEIDFVLPENLADYAVVSNLPLVKENELDFQVTGNTIFFLFKDYETVSNVAISIGVYDFEKVRDVEQRRATAQSSYELMVVADKLKELSGGPHCSFCTGPASDLAKKYYGLAIDKTSTKNDLLWILESYIFWHKDGIAGLEDINQGELVKSGMDQSFGTNPCVGDKEKTDKVCLENLFENPYLFRSNIGISRNKVQGQEFLQQTAAKMDAFDPVLAGGIRQYISLAEKEAKRLRIESEQWQKEATPSAGETPTTPTIPAFAPTKSIKPIAPLRQPYATLSDQCRAFFRRNGIKLAFGASATATLILLAVRLKIGSSPSAPDDMSLPPKSANKGQKTI